MSDLMLTRQSPLSELELDFGEVAVAELVSRAIVSIATPYGGGKKLSEAVASSLKTEIPAIGKSTTSNVDSALLLGMQQDQMFLLFDYSGNNAVDYLPKEIKDAGYLTDQSDSWVMISIFGPKARTALQQTCSVDLHSSNFRERAVIRTVIANLSTIIVCEGENTFLVMSPRSSAKSFYKVLETSIRNLSR